MTIAAGTQLGPYKVLGPIGAGGMGEVYRRGTPVWTASSPSRFCRIIFPTEPSCASDSSAKHGPLPA